ncbi:hypothetical protein D3C77_448520 [compost metagenome]
MIREARSLCSKRFSLLIFIQSTDQYFSYPLAGRFLLPPRLIGFYRCEFFILIDQVLLNCQLDIRLGVSADLQIRWRGVPTAEFPAQIHEANRHRNGFLLRDTVAWPEFSCIPDDNALCSQLINIFLRPKAVLHIAKQSKCRIHSVAIISPRIRR